MSPTPTVPSMTARLAGVWERQWEEDPLGCEEDKIDRTTLVVWTQTPCGIYVDLRLPAGDSGRQECSDRVKRPEALAARGNLGGKYTDEERAMFLQQKSFAGRLQCSIGDTTNGQALGEDKALAELVNANTGPFPLCTCFWEREIDYQPPTGGLDIGVCASSLNADGTVDMRETGYDASYAEGWRRMVGTVDGPFAALELVSENGIAGRTGFWVRAGDQFAYTVGRPEDIASASSLGCNSLSSKIKDCTGNSLSEAVKLLANGKDEELAIAQSYVALVGEVERSGAWRIGASNLPELTGCILVGGMEAESLCCSSLSVASGMSPTNVGEGAILDQAILTGDGGEVMRQWKVVELSSPLALSLI